MSGNGDDRDIEKWFESVRREDRRGAPPFERAWREALGRATGPSRGVGGLRVALGAALATAAIAAGILLVRDHRGGGLSFSAEEVAMAREISEWTAPSDGIVFIARMRETVGVPRLEIESVRLPPTSEPEESGNNRPSSLSPTEPP